MPECCLCSIVLLQTLLCAIKYFRWLKVAALFFFFSMNARQSSVIVCSFIKALIHFPKSLRVEEFE